MIDHGITVGGKTLREHLEAVDHYEAVLWVRKQATLNVAIDQRTICELYRPIVARSQPDIAGIYSNHTRRIADSRVIFPNPMKIPGLMDGLGEWLKSASPFVCLD